MNASETHRLSQIEKIAIPKKKNRIKSIRSLIKIEESNNNNNKDGDGNNNGR